MWIAIPFYWSQSIAGRATLLRTLKDPDITLLQLNGMPPAGVIFAGWATQKTPVGYRVVGIHHPSGDMQKISFGSVDGFRDCKLFSSNGLTICSYSPNGSYFSVKWSQGTIEGGSSGSGIFADGYLVGALSSGNYSCSYGQSFGSYARFDLFYPFIKQWIDPVAAPSNPTTPATRNSPVFRLVNKNTGTHLYTLSVEERDQAASQPNYQYEGVAFYAKSAQGAGLLPVYRFFNTGNNAYFYTLSPQEREYIMASLPSLKYEGVAWYVQEGAPSSSKPVFRFVNPVTGAHFYTVNDTERAYIVANNPGLAYEGVSYYVWIAP